jgi:predicted TIM-barrel fold metal-dependent hydrolase
MENRMATSLADEIKVIDTDTHVIEPYDLWTSRVSAKWGDKIPQVRWNDELQEEHWYFGGKPVWQAAGSVMAGFNRHPPEHPKRKVDSEQAAWEAKPRAALMDRYGVHMQVLYPNVCGFGLGRFMELGERTLMLECVRAYNDFLAEFSADAPGRFIPIMALPFWDIKESLAEMRRALDMGHRGIVFGGSPEDFGQPPLSSRQWDPIFAAAQEMRLSINFHIGAGDLSELKQAVADNGRHANYAKNSVLYFLSNANTLCEIICAGVCHRFPKLNFVSVESGVGWLPFVLDALDWMWKNCGVSREHPEYDLLPSEYFRRQIYGCFWFESKTMRMALDLLGENNIMYETDFPHPTSMSPGPASIAKLPRDFIDEALAGLPKSTAQKVLHDNAARVYGIS